MVRSFILRRHRVVVAAVLIFCLVVAIVPSAAFAECTGSRGYCGLIILTNIATVGFHPGYVSMYTNQFYGAPWCYICDEHSHYLYASGAYALKSYRYFKNWQSDTSFNHFGVKREYTYDPTWTGSMKVICKSTRYSNTNQLGQVYLGTFQAAEYFVHKYDRHTVTKYGSI